MAKPLLLFVHGLGGSVATWGKFSDLIANDSDLHEKVSVAFYSFSTHILRFRPFWKSLSLQELAKGLATEIDTRYHEHDKILLVCHSMGGMIAKRYIIDRLKRNLPLRVREVVFFAVPHAGAASAGYASRFSLRHRHLNQLQKESDFIESIAEDWHAHKCESMLGTTYIVAGQDAVVPRTSAAPPGVSYDLVPDKGHRDVVKPVDSSDMSFLLVRQVAKRLLTSWRDDLVEARHAIATRDDRTLLNLIANRGRSWIETAEAGEAIAVFETIIDTFDSSSAQVIWSKYLLAIAHLFRDRAAPSEAFDDSMVAKAGPIGLAPLLLAERMEFARKRGDRDGAAQHASALLKQLAATGHATDATHAYAIGTAYFLIANLYRFGGSYRSARQLIDRARQFYRPTILSHQIELAHCKYASAVCQAMEGSLISGEGSTTPPGPEFRRFADALIMLTHAHSSWANGQLGVAIDQATRAAMMFQQIAFGSYSLRAQSLANLLKAWRKFELGATPAEALAHIAGQERYIRGLVGEDACKPDLVEWLRTARPSKALGALQFASAYNPDWDADIGTLTLPPILKINGDAVAWETHTCRSLWEADSKLRLLMEVPQGLPIPLVPD